MSELRLDNPLIVASIALNGSLNTRGKDHLPKTSFHEQHANRIMEWFSPIALDIIQTLLKTSDNTRKEPILMTIPEVHEPVSETLPTQNQEDSGFRIF